MTFYQCFILTWLLIYWISDFISNSNFTMSIIISTAIAVNMCAFNGNIQLKRIATFRCNFNRKYNQVVWRQFMHFPCCVATRGLTRLANICLAVSSSVFPWIPTQEKSCWIEQYKMHDDLLCSRNDNRDSQTNNQTHQHAGDMCQWHALATRCYIEAQVHLALQSSIFIDFVDCLSFKNFLIRIIVK